MKSLFLRASLRLTLILFAALAIDATGNLIRAATDAGIYEINLGSACTPPTARVAGDNEVCEDGSRTLTAVVESGTAPFAYQWHKDGALLNGATAETLTLNNVTPDDAGVYSVIVKNACGQALSSPSPIFRVFGLMLSPTNQSFPASGGTGKLTVSSPPICAGQDAISEAPWIVITRNVGTIDYTVAPNTGPARTGIIRVFNRFISKTLTISQAAGAASDPNAVVWTNLINTRVFGNILRKVGGGNDGRWDGSASSQQVCSSGDCYLEFTVSGPLLYRAAGLADNTVLGNEQTVDFAVVFPNTNIAEFRDNGRYVGEARFSSGDIFQVAVENGIVNYYHNGIRRATSKQAPLYPLRAVAIFSYLNGEISTAKLFAGRPKNAASVTTMVEQANRKTLPRRFR